MLKTYNKVTYIGLAIILITVTINFATDIVIYLPAFYGLMALQAIGSILAIYGYAKAKGHSGLWSIFGLLGFWGLLVGFILPDKFKDESVIENNEATNVK